MLETPFAEINDAEQSQWVSVLGSTGSIGKSTLDVIERHSPQYKIFALTANTSTEKMFQQCLRTTPRYAVMLNTEAAEQLRSRLAEVSQDTEVLTGVEGLCQVAAAAEVDIVMAAIVGAAGLEPTLAAVEASKKVLLANKESLVMAGQLFMNAVHESGCILLPIDSEHNAIFQCMPATSTAQPRKQGVENILLTASGGPFREWSREQMQTATPAQACAHPNWDMGRKISVDSATLMNKGLELIEACWLFDLSAQDVEVVVHPQSVVHSMVQYVDGSVLAELGNPDMRTSIAYGLSWPRRISSGVPKLDMIKIAGLDFQAPDEARFPCLALAKRAVTMGGTAAVALNASNEVAVAAFLQEQIVFTDIPVVVERVLNATNIAEPSTLDVVKRADARAREQALETITEMLNG